MTTGSLTATSCSGIDTLDCALEISSMGIRVDEKSLEEQLKSKPAVRTEGTFLITGCS